MSVCICADHIHAGACRGQKENWISLNWKYRQLWTIMWALGTILGSSIRASNVLSCWAILSAPAPLYLLTQGTHCVHWTILELTTFPAQSAGIKGTVFSLCPLLEAGSLAHSTSPFMSDLKGASEVWGDFCPSAHSLEGITKCEHALLQAVVTRHLVVWREERLSSWHAWLWGLRPLWMEAEMWGVGSHANGGVQVQWPRQSKTAFNEVAAGRILYRPKGSASITIYKLN